jgi:uncharacterized protein involved in response to NO
MALQPSRLTVFSAAPHRMMFFAGAVQLVATLLFWGAELAGRSIRGWASPPTVIPAIFAHTFLMPYALFPFFMFGFLMTTYPRWMNGSEIPRHRYTTAFVLLASGAVLYYPGLYLSKDLLTAGVTLLLAGWAAALRALFIVYRLAPASDKRYETVLNFALGAGWIGLLCYLLWLITSQPLFLDLSQQVGIWLFLAVVLVTVSHRMIPFFSSSVLENYKIVRPGWSLPVLLIGVIGHLALTLAELRQWLFVFDLPLAFLGLHHSLSWKFFRSFKVRLLAVLHIAFLWWSIAMLLFSVQSLALLIGGEHILGKAPIHALGIGFIASMTLGMASRVTLGHSGRPLVLDGFSLACFLGVTFTALLRIAAEIPLLAENVGVSFNLLAAGAWLLFMGAWVSRYAPMTLRPRVDGKAG